MRPILFALVSLLTVAVVTPARAGEEEDKRAENAVRVLKEVMEAPDKAIPQDLLREAHAIGAGLRRKIIESHPNCDVIIHKDVAGER